MRGLRSFLFSGASVGGTSHKTKVGDDDVDSHERTLNHRRRGRGGEHSLADPEAYQCARTLASLIELRLDQPLTGDEVCYLALHVSRIAHTASPTPPPQPEAGADTHRKENTMITKTATISSCVGLHARPAALFTSAVQDTDLDITISLGGEEADASSLLEVMTLGAQHGEVVTLSCEDDSAEAALAELAAMLERDLDAE